jgi:hypothetical protein
MEKRRLIPHTPIQFAEGTCLKHLKTGDLYLITLTPESGLRIEATGEPAYGYRPLQDTTPVWVRSQTETEDGRFLQMKPDGKKPDPLILSPDP